MSVALAILVTAILGAPVALAVDSRVRGGVMLALGFLYGAGLVYLVELAIACAGLRWNVPSVTGAAAIVSAACGAFAWRRRRGEPVARMKLTPLDGVTAAVVVVYAIFATVARVWEWDFWAIWGLKGRVFFDAATIDWQFLANRWNAFAHPDYPLLLPLNDTYAALVGGGWDDRWLGLMNVAFGGALLLIVRHLSSLESRPIVASAIALASASFALSPYIGLADGALIAFAGAAILFLRRAIVYQDDAAARHGALLAGLAASTKNEGQALLVVLTIVCALMGRRFALKLWPGFLVALPWVVLRAVHGLATDLVRGSYVDRVAERSAAALPIIQSLSIYLNMRWMWCGILVSLLVARQHYRRERFVLFVVLLQLALYVAVILGGPNEVQWQIETAWGRLSSHPATPLLVVVMLMLARTFAPEDDLAHAEARSEH